MTASSTFVCGCVWEGANRGSFMLLFRYLSDTSQPALHISEFPSLYPSEGQTHGRGSTASGCEPLATPQNYYLKVAPPSIGLIPDSHFRAALRSLRLVHQILISASILWQGKYTRQIWTYWTNISGEANFGDFADITGKKSPHVMLENVNVAHCKLQHGSVAIAIETLLRDMRLMPYKYGTRNVPDLRRVVNASFGGRACSFGQLLQYKACLSGLYSLAVVLSVQLRRACRAGCPAAKPAGHGMQPSVRFNGKR
eukprot:scaffold672401_cov53-Prasinocladus_malaysianus.AAC.1